MDPGVLTSLIVAGGSLVAGTVAVFVKRGSDGESAKNAKANTFTDQLQEQGSLDREAAAKARVEADTARSMLAAAEQRFRTEMSALWTQMETTQRQVDDMRRQHRADLEADDDYINLLITHINERREPPPPVRPARRST